MLDMRFFCFSYKSELQATEDDSFKQAKTDSLKKKKLGSSDKCYKE